MRNGLPLRLSESCTVLSSLPLTKVASRGSKVKLVTKSLLAFGRAATYCCVPPRASLFGQNSRWKRPALWIESQTGNKLCWPAIVRNNLPVRASQSFTTRSKLPLASVPV